MHEKEGLSEVSQNHEVGGGGRINGRGKAPTPWGRRFKRR